MSHYGIKPLLTGEFLSTCICLGVTGTPPRNAFQELNQKGFKNMQDNLKEKEYATSNRFIVFWNLNYLYVAPNNDLTKKILKECGYVENENLRAPRLDDTTLRPIIECATKDAFKNASNGGKRKFEDVLDAATMDETFWLMYTWQNDPAFKPDSLSACMRAFGLGGEYGINAAMRELVSNSEYLSQASFLVNIGLSRNNGELKSKKVFLQAKKMITPDVNRYFCDCLLAEKRVSTQEIILYYPHLLSLLKELNDADFDKKEEILNEIVAQFNAAKQEADSRSSRGLS